MDTSARLIVNDVGTLYSACLSGYAIAQIMALGAEALLAEGQLVDLFPDWPDERFPLYAPRATLTRRGSGRSSRSGRTA